LILERVEPIRDHAPQGTEIKPEIRKTLALQSAETLAEQDRCTPGVAALEMNMRHGHLDQALKDPAVRIRRLMPEILQHVMGFIPLLVIKKLDPLVKTGIEADGVR